MTTKTELRIRTSMNKPLTPLVRVLQGAIMNVLPTSLNKCTGYLPFYGSNCGLKGAAILHNWLPCAIQSCGQQALAVPFCFIGTAPSQHYDYERPTQSKSIGRNSSGLLQEEPATSEQKFAQVVVVFCCSFDFILPATTYGELCAYFCHQYDTGIRVSVAENLERNKRTNKSSRSQTFYGHGYRHAFDETTCLRNRYLVPAHHYRATWLRCSEKYRRKVLLEQTMQEQFHQS